jgi:hypothetical protein
MENENECEQEPAALPNFVLVRCSLSRICQGSKGDERSLITKVKVGVYSSEAAAEVPMIRTVTQV